MFTITVTKTAARNGSGNVVAKGHGKQKTTRWDHSKSRDENMGAGVGALLDRLLTDEQRAKMRHPSARGRVRVESLSEYGGKERWHIDV